MYLDFISLIGFVILYSTPVQQPQPCDLSGEYVYQEYKLRLPNGQILGLRDLGIASSKLSFSDNAVSVENTLTDGTVVRETATIWEAKGNGQEGYWIAKWPHVRSPARTDFKSELGSISYQTRFEDPLDVRLFGHVETAKLMRVDFAAAYEKEPVPFCRQVRLHPSFPRSSGIGIHTPLTSKTNGDRLTF